ncbi:FAD:protein FMN transferase [Cohnella suwonensis]|uniref:FAD:protein FMN transferase n=1 Tax=Cohnella suwonensis TaxID=696072 RepID=A0ABW0LXT5_9BACL
MIRTIRDEFRAMNTDVEVTLRCDVTGEDDKPLIEIRDWFRFVEDRFSRFRDNSELSRLNGSRGFPTSVSSAMLEVLSHAEEYRRLTNGIYDPCILLALERSGYSVSFESVGAAAGAIDDAHPIHGDRLGWTTFPLFRLARLSRGARLDLGGLVKGWAVDRIAAMLSASGIPSGHLNAGGDLRVWGWGQAGLPDWQVDIAPPCPFSEEEEPAILATAILGQGSAATSGTTRRSWMSADGGKHHLIDPRTGVPAISDVVQCTVVGSSTADAEIAAKTVCILGSGEGEAWVKETFPGYDVLMALDNGTTKLLRGIGSSVRWKEAAS